SYDIFKLASSGADGSAVPGVDYTNTGVDLAAAGGTLFIAKKTAGYDVGTGAFAADQYVADLVGWGSSNVAEDTAADVAAVTSSSSLTRAAGAVDTDMNADDFSVGAPTPNTAPSIPTKAIAEIQGTGPTTPMANAQVTTTGVVTAAYPSGTGNFSGFYIQTPGADTPEASDGLFVFTGSQALAPAPAVGDAVTVTGKISEFSGMTEMTLGTTAGSYANSGASAQAVVSKNVLPGTDCALPGTDCLTGAALEAEREKHEGEAFQPTAPFTVSDSYDGTPWSQAGSRGFQMAGEIGLAANDTEPLMAPTQVVNPSDASGLAARNAYNDAHMITLDDGANVDYTSVTGSAFPWLTPTHTVRMGADVTFTKPVVLDYRNSLWKVQPQGKVTGDGETYVHISQDRDAAPDNVLGDTGDLKIATFNMLNYFNTTGEQWVADDPVGGGVRKCTYYTDRANNRISNNTCEETDSSTTPPTVLPGPRGAANQANFLRQEAKELEAINTMDADVMSLEEVENSTKVGDADRDDAIIRLVGQLNAHWAAAHPSYVGDRWAYAPSPRAAAQPTLLEQDAIRSAFIYNPSKVELVGPSRILVNSAPFRNAREPLAQAFKPLGTGRANAFGVIVNHFKSKGDSSGTASGDNVDRGDGAGSYNGDRKRQAAALLAFSDQFQSDRGIDKMFLTGDYNAYAKEDPIKVITDGGYHDLHPANNEQTYSFGGLAGSLDHVFANEAAHAMVTGEDVWSINANESVYYEYSRYNSNVTDLYAANPFRSSDHNPEIIGIDAGDPIPDPDVDTVQVLATNDFHGRILDDPGSAAAGAASLAGAVKTLRAENPDTVFAAAGDLIGASTFESFIAHDKPTIDALNEAGLEVSAAGNHEFDRGYRDLVDRVMKPYDAETNPYGGAAWQYIAANVRMRDDHSAALPETWYRELPDGRTIGFVGAVTEDLPSLVAGDGLSEIEITDIVDSVNTYADQLKAPGGCGESDGCDLVIELVHEGAATTAYSSVTDDSTFAHIVAGADEDIDAIVSGHTHLAYNHKVPVQEWADEGRVVTKRPVVSAGQYGANLNRLEFEFLPGTDELVNIRQTVLALKDYDADPATQDIVDDAVAVAAEQGNVPLGDLEAPFQRALRKDAVTNTVVENRGGESTLGNLVAEIQRWKTGADIGLMNPGGLRADLIGNDGTPRVLTYRQAADAQPFANTLVTMDLTGAQIKTILEQQWQRDADGNIPSRPFLRLGTSKGFTSTYDASLPEGRRITGMWLDGVPLDPSATYRVAATSFLASGTGDNFWGFAAATNKQDTGKTDLQGVVDYLAEFAEHGVDAPLPVDSRQHAVGIAFPASAPATYGPGDTLSFSVSSLAMTGAGDQQDTEVALMLGDTVLGTFPVSNTLEGVPFDEAGTASVSVPVPDAVADGRTEFTLRGTTTGTRVTVPVATSDGRPDTTVTGSDQEIVYGEPGTVLVTVGPSTASGTVTLKDGDTVLGSGTLEDGAAEVALGAGSLPVGTHQLTLVYAGDADHSGSTDTVEVTVTKATPTITATPTPASVEVNDGTSSIAVTVSATGVDPSGTVTASVDGDVVDSQTLVDGAATLTVGPFATAGDETVTIDYTGDDTTSTGSTTTSVTVREPTPPPLDDTTTRATAAPMVYGTDGTVDVTVAPGTVTGSVQLLDGETVIGSGTLDPDGKVSIPVLGTALSVGSHTLDVDYLGDSGHKPSEDSVVIVVSKADSTTQAVVTPTRLEVRGDTATVQASVTATGFTPTGNVEVYVDGTLATTGALTDGSDVLQVGPFATVGQHRVVVTYVGDSTTRTSSSSAQTVTVVKATPTMTVTTSPSPITTRSKVAMTVALTAPGQVPTGTVTVTWGKKDKAVGNLSGGHVVLPLGQFAPAGDYTFKVSYSGSPTVEDVTATKTITVLKK
ncbi:MAG: ExeM/NucH family extracellular endonuclease, partial [Nocardioides sp.]